MVLLDKMLTNLPIDQASPEPHPILDKLVLSFRDDVRCKEIKGENGAEILVHDRVLCGLVIGNFSSFEEYDLTDPERLFSCVCSKSPEFTVALFKLLCNFEFNKAKLIALVHSH